METLRRGSQSFQRRGILWRQRRDRSGELDVATTGEVEMEGAERPGRDRACNPGRRKRSDQLCNRALRR
jgi:hypothetical protein